MPGDRALNRRRLTWWQATAAFISVVIGLVMGPITTVVAHEDGQAVVEVQPSRIVAGSTIQIVGDGFTPATTVSMTLLTDEAVPLGSAVVDSEGHFIADIMSGDNWAARPYEVAVVADDGDAASGFFTVLETPDDGNSSTVRLAAAAGIAGLCAGFALLVLRRRRNRRLVG